MPVIPFDHESERVVAVLVSPLETGETYGLPLTIGIYPTSPGEVWIEIEGQRFSIQNSDIPLLCKQLKRAAGLSAQGQEEQT